MCTNIEVCPSCTLLHIFCWKLPFTSTPLPRSPTQTWVLGIIFAWREELRWVIPMLLTGTTFGARCCLIAWSLEQKRRLLEGETGPRGKFCSHFYAAAVDSAAARDSPGLWAPDGALSSWVILLRGFGRTILIKIRTDSKLCLHSLLSLILHIPEDEQTQQGYR